MKTLSVTLIAFLGGLAVRQAADPCCVVTAVSAKGGTVSAKEKATGRTFAFTANATVLRSLHVGSPVYANFASKQVSLDGKSGCCQIQSLTAPSPGALQSKIAPGIAGAASTQSLILPDLAPYAFYNPATPACPDPNFCQNTAQGCPPSAILDIPVGVWNLGPGTTAGTMTVELWTIPEFSGAPAKVGSWISSAPLGKNYRVLGKLHWTIQCVGAGGPSWPTRPTYTLQVRLTGQNEARTDNNSVELKIPPNFQIVAP